ncbi:hypothetical protein BD770DRAFT_445613 [Pilaira anomala]|nr:hypothetical protein BD770DRAFT_445613 [Pilaira anomala]
MEIIYKLEDFPEPGDRDLFNGIQEINKNNYQDALQHFERGANYDNKYAMLFLAILYYTGYGLPERNPVKAMNLFKKIASQWRNPVAQFFLGILYFYGDYNISKDEQCAMDWFELSANNSWSYALAYIGFAYERGIFVDPDHQKAIDLYEKIANKDDNDNGTIDDGTLYLFGNKKFELDLSNVSKEIISKICCKTNNIVAISPDMCLCNNYFITTSLDIKRIMLWESLLTNKKSSAVAASQSSISALYALELNNVPQDFKKTVYWAKKGIKNGSSISCAYLASCYEEGVGVSRNIKEAMKLYKKSLSLGGDTNFQIGFLYYKGIQIEKDWKQALSYFEVGKRGIRDYKKALEYYTKSFELGNLGAAHFICVLYARGLGVKRDDKQAFEWLQKASSRGCLLASSSLEAIDTKGFRNSINDILRNRDLIHNLLTNHSEIFPIPKVHIYPALRANPYPEVTDLFCRLPRPQTLKIPKITRDALGNNHTFELDYKKEESFDKDWINLVVSSLVREYENGDMDRCHNEQWYQSQIWSMIESCFDKLENIEAVCGESASLGIHHYQYLEPKGNTLYLKADTIDSKYDCRCGLMFRRYNIRHSVPLEFGASEAKSIIENFPDPGDQDLFNGIQEINKNNYQKALKHFEKGSKYDNEYASLFSAIVYFTGFGLSKRDPIKSVKIFQFIASKWDNPVAQYFLGVVYSYGDDGIPMDKKASFRWFQQSAKNNWAFSIGNVGYAYSFGGEGVKEDHQKARAWMEKVVKNDESESELIDDGTLYLFGNKNFELDFSRIDKKIVSKALESTRDKLVSPVVCLSEDNDSTMANWSEIQRVIIWDILTNKNSSAVADCQYLMIGLYVDGKNNIPQDLNKAMYWAKKSAKNGSSGGCRYVALQYEEGTVVKQNYTEAMKWYKKSHDIGRETESTFSIGRFYYQGLGVKINYHEALTYFKIAAFCGHHSAAYFYMGEIYENGKGVPIDYKQAIACYMNAFEFNYPTGATAIGLFYCKGEGVKRDEKKAIEWLNRGLVAGCLVAPAILDKIKHLGFQATANFPDPGDNDILKGIQEINKNNYQRSLKHFEKASQYDNEYADLFVALIHFTGFGLSSRDPPKAMELFKKISSKWNSPVAQHFIGCMYFEGDFGVPQNGKSGIYWLSLAANNGWSDAMNRLGIAYRLGTFVESNYKKAAFWFEKVAQKDDNEKGIVKDGALYLFGNKKFEVKFNIVDQNFLATMCLDKNDNIGSPVLCCQIQLPDIPPILKVLQRIFIWDSLTNKKSNNVSVSQFNLAVIYIEGDKYVVKDESKFWYWLKKAIKNRHQQAHVTLGNMYESGVGIERDYKQAMKWYKKAYDLEGKNDIATLCIGRLYYNGKGVERNHKTALSYLEKTLVSPNIMAHFMIGEIYRHGKDGVTQDYQKALTYYLQSVKDGDAKGATELGILFRDGLGVKIDEEIAFMWFEKAALMGCPKGQYILGSMYLEGYKGIVDLDKALSLFKRACTGNHAGAMSMIIKIEEMMCCTEDIPNLVPQ